MGSYAKGAPTGATRRCFLRGALATSVLAPLSGCGVLEGSQGSAQGGSGSLERSSIRVAELPIIDTAPLHIAQEKGYFKEAGLSVNLVEAQGSAETIPQLVAGDLDFTFVDWTSLFSAQDKGVSDFLVVNAGYEAREHTFVVMALPSSGIVSPRDMANKTVAVNVFNNVSQLAAKAGLEIYGVTDNLNFVELPFPKMPAALQSGDIDAALLVEPFITKVQRDLGARSVLDTAVGGTENLPIAGYATTRPYAQKNPKTVAAFRRAMDRAQADTRDRALVERTVSKYVSVDREVVQLLSFGAWPLTIEKTRLQRVSNLMSTYNVLNKPLDVSALLST